LFLCSQGKVELSQEGSLYAPLRLKRLLSPGTIAQLPLASLNVPAATPAKAAMAA
ncbi:MAG: segregation and condensation protein A, partial [Prochlorococcus sp.]